ncbi:MAG: FHA domain-containing protein [Nitrospirae bacterium]|nr:MAG: FHA domain-containing protein [Nitrospirota bacterium]
MSLVKICPTCKTRNEPSEMMCGMCLGDISGVSPVDNEQPPVSMAEDRTIVQRGGIVLKLSGGGDIPVCDGDIVGREAVGKEILQPYKTISRRHVRFTFENGGWLIEDLNSTNGTYLNGNRLAANAKTPVAHNQKLSLSSACEIVIERK